MAFVRVATWEVQARATTWVFPAWLYGRRISQVAALALSLAVDIALIAALIWAGRIDAPKVLRSSRSIPTFDLPSPERLEAGVAAPASTIWVEPIDNIEATKSSPVSAEWSTTTLPPLKRAEIAPAADLPAQTVVTPATNGTASSSTKPNEGYDPYAFAAYHGMTPSGIAANGTDMVQTVPVPLPAALARLQTALRKHLRLSGRQITMRFTIDPAGRIAHAEMIDALPPGLAAAAATTAQGLELCAADPARRPGTMAIATFDL